MASLIPPPTEESLTVSQEVLLDGATLTNADTLYRSTVCRLMEAHGYRAVSVARLYGAGLPYAPGFRWMRFMAGAAREAVEHGAAIASCYESIAGQRLEPVLERRLHAVAPPLAMSRAELAVALLVSGRGWLSLLREHDGCSYQPYRAVVAQVAREVEARQVMAERFFADAVRLEGAAVVEPFLDGWVERVLEGFGRSGTPGAAYALSVGLRRREVGVMVREFLDDLRRVTDAAGVSFTAGEDSAAPLWDEDSQG